MAVPMYLAGTPGGFSGCGHAITGCRFSLEDSGLCRIPQSAPQHSLILIDDRVPIHGHKIGTVSAQLEGIFHSLSPAAILLDWERPPEPEATDMAGALAERFPVIVPDSYGKSLACPVFISRPSLCQPLPRLLAPWKGRDIWLELLPDAQELYVTPAGCQVSSLLSWEFPAPHQDDTLFLSYGMELGDTWAKFLLRREPRHLLALAQAAENLGISGFVGFYPQLKQILTKKPPS